MAARQSLANSFSHPSSLDLGDLMARLRELRAQPSRRDAYRPEILGASLVMQAGEIRNAYHHGLDADALGPRMAELLCDLVQFADAIEVDIERTTERYVCGCEERMASSARVSRRPAHSPAL